MLRALHLIYVGPPNSTGGAVRTHDVLVSQKDSGLHVVAVSSPFQPSCMGNNGIDVIDGVTYYRTFSGIDAEIASEKISSLYIQLRKLTRIWSFTRHSLRIARDFEPNIIHSHSSFFCGLCGLVIGRICGLPVVYEVRSLWEERRRDGGWVDQVTASIIRIVETFTCRRADHVVAINSALKDEIVSRGISASKVTVIGNAVRHELVSSDHCKRKTIAARPAKAPRTFGYVGNISKFEGLFELVQAWKKIEKQQIDAELHFYGDGRDKESLEAEVESLELTSVYFHGSFEHNEIEKVYADIDVIVLPRRKNKLSDTVTPIKPLEAMLCRSLVVVSDVGGLREMVVDGETGIIFDGTSAPSIAAVITEVLSLPADELDRIIDNAHNWVLANRSWKSNAKKYEAIYEELGKGA